MTTTNANLTLTAETIAKLEAKGFRRWTKGSMDRLYINAKGYGVEYTRYASGKVSGGEFAGEQFGAYEARNFEATKVYIDVKTGELHVTTNTDFENEIREAVEAIIAECMPETETETETETSEEETMIKYEASNVKQAEEDYKRFLWGQTEFDMNTADNHFVVDGREYEVTTDEDGNDVVTRVSVDEDAAYEIVIEDADESCDEVLLSETFAGEAEANARYAELRDEFLSEDGGWRDGLNLWLFADGDSIDGESK